jgi:hypothetical protein
MGKSWQPWSGKIEQFRGATRRIVDFGSAFESFGRFIKVTLRGHAEIHAGVRYTSCKLYTGVGNNASAYLYIGNTTSDKEFHCTFFASPEGKAYTYVYEGSELDSALGTELTPRNHKRNKASNPDDSTALIYHTVTVADNGTLLCEGMSPGGTGGHSVGTSEGFGDERIIGPGQNFLFRLLNKAGSAKDIEMQITHYEVDEGST